MYRNDKITLTQVAKGGYTHIVISPGPGSPDEPSYFGICGRIILDSGKTTPVLGVCLGHQGIIYAFGGKIIRAGVIKHGKTSKIEHNQKDLFQNVRDPLAGMRYHSLVGEKTSLPDCLEITAKSIDDEEIMGIRHKKYPVFGVQFHPESVGTDDGKIILKNFLSIK